ncbi:guanylyl cyclase-activating protein 2-like [Carassius auratus]|uniref:Guanylyl cyclase-activating protein 2-like n=1 Tax=Carassius auratus TaxID=7957 RepID=A0A6P6MBL0_CARAU|nr:guanylyl cyclase-activating protein 2-like [Carassius auratus]
MISIVSCGQRLSFSMGQIQSDEDKEVELSDIQPLYTKFMRECPSGALHLHEFRKIFGIQSTSEDEALYIETLFKSFDTNRDDVIDFMEFVAAVHLVLRGKLEDRLKWSFKVYDKDDNGKLDRQEVKRVIKIICQLQRNHINMTPGDICDRIFEHLDENKDGGTTHQGPVAMELVISQSPALAVWTLLYYSSRACSSPRVTCPFTAKEAIP